MRTEMLKRHIEAKQGAAESLVARRRGLEAVGYGGCLKMGCLKNGFYMFLYMQKCLKKCLTVFFCMLEVYHLAIICRTIWALTRMPCIYSNRYVSARKVDVSHLKKKHYAWQNGVGLMTGTSMPYCPHEQKEVRDAEVS